MSNFGRTLFGGSAFIRRTLTPFVLIFAVFLPLLIDAWTPARVLFMAGIEFICALLLGGLWLPSQYSRWAFRILAGMVFLAYVAYAVHEFFFTHKAFRISGSRAEDTPYNSLLGLTIIGLPSLCYALFGRFTLRPPPPDPAETNPETDDDHP